MPKVPPPDEDDDKVGFGLEDVLLLAIFVILGYIIFWYFKN